MSIITKKSTTKVCVIIFSTLLVLSNNIVIDANTLSINSWGYQLQDYDLEILRQSDYDLIVLDYSKDGSELEKFTSDEIEDISAADKVLLSYISIGEAEDYRYYFDQNWKSNPPEWMDGENPEWEGNYKVKYWNAEWQDLIFGYLDKIIAQGFDGVYLDIIDAYEFYEPTQPSAKQDMIDFVISIANYTRTQVSEFLIFPQNGEELLADENYRNIVNGIGREDLFILPDEQEIRDDFELEVITSFLDLLLDDDKPVLTVDYTSDPDLIIDAKEMASDRGYIEYIGVLELDVLVHPNYTGNLVYSNRFQIIMILSITIIGITGWIIRKIRFNKIQNDD